jgi:hypothetical protein
MHISTPLQNLQQPHNDVIEPELPLDKLLDGKCIQILRHQTIVDKYTYKEGLHFSNPVDSSETNQFTVLHDLALLELTSKANSATDHEIMDAFSTLHLPDAYGCLLHITSSSTTYHQI